LPKGKRSWISSQHLDLRNPLLRPKWILPGRLSVGGGRIGRRRADYQDHDVVVVPMPSEPGVKFDYQVAMGVRHGETKWKQRIDGLIESKLPQIREILQSYRIPLQDL
jgi:hypothetical protein